MPVTSESPSNWIENWTSDGLGVMSDPTSLRSLLRLMAGNAEHGRFHPDMVFIFRCYTVLYLETPAHLRKTHPQGYSLQYLAFPSMGGPGILTVGHCLCLVMDPFKNENSESLRSKRDGGFVEVAVGIFLAIQLCRLHSNRGRNDFFGFLRII
jgi:hypothetical protein